MAGRKSKPIRVKKREGKGVTLNPMQKAMAVAAYLTPSERGIVMQEAMASFARLRCGEAVRQDWCYLADAANVGEALSKLGICSDEASRNILAAFQQALKSFADRANGRGIWTATGAELKAIEEGLERHEIQLRFTTIRDLRKAMTMVQATVRAARAGKIATVTIVEGAAA